jgi:5-methyltetrahydrofolate--homocysteine methyltransferase
MLQQAGLPRGKAPESWILENPAAVQALHRSYAGAGSNLVLTNTFGGNRLRLEKHGLADRTEELNRTAVHLAREAVGSQVFVVGDVGPTGQLLKPYGPLGYAEAVAVFAGQARGLAAGQPDAILIETMGDLNEAKAAVEGVRSATDLPVMVSFSFDTRGSTMMGLKPAQAVKELKALGVFAAGANCGNTLTETLAAIQAMRQAEPDMPLLAKPNAGLPRLAQAGEKQAVVYDVTPEEMAEYALRFKEVGVIIFGGCCGSTPDHIHAAALALRS